MQTLEEHADVVERGRGGSAYDGANQSITTEAGTKCFSAEELVHMVSFLFPAHNVATLLLAKRQRQRETTLYQLFAGQNSLPS